MQVQLKINMLERRSNEKAGRESSTDAIRDAAQALTDAGNSVEQSAAILIAPRRRSTRL
ncbi:hypothetical protein [Nocardia sp. CC201C]|uniref:hypothetical protein n=1 Tax=Nocardia sp. CC201C TaxID=3044575 RepID=UPI0024A8551A|nr:hypothetical protein [Nocardia sp. CC201C]